MESTGLIHSVTLRLRNLRRGSRFEARLPFIITPLGATKISGKRLPSAPAMVGHTRDLSETSMTLLLPSVRAGNVYLTDSENCLEVKLELPGGPVTILTNSVRFEQLSSKEAGCSYLLAVRIVEMQNEERARYKSYLKTIKRKRSRTRDRRQNTASTSSTATKDTEQEATLDALTPASINHAFEQFLED